eukprot:Gregarina_sp_Poly_1__4312@NODE_233_length_11059_cov_49_751365_g206_i0_p10_GENE_NODE_233_length_11059_cov_49_751365_g206_i0NODE_233_length_11059_cov_49_751365_g206_i0_p10_ORF_typecomplete_len139_score18_18HORMA/PF02301_18/3_9e07_NODE_233_length_11059_cov_49_751365_g206_i057766192
MLLKIKILESLISSCSAPILLKLKWYYLGSKKVSATFDAAPNPLGVFDALEKQYLRLLAFGIHNSDDELLEVTRCLTQNGKFPQCYHFKFAYDCDATEINVTRTAGQDEQQAKSRVAKGKDEARQQTLSLLKSVCVPR